jgi:hypothetical protein
MIAPGGKHLPHQMFWVIALAEYDPLPDKQPMAFQRQQAAF